MGQGPHPSQGFRPPTPASARHIPEALACAACWLASAEPWARGGRGLGTERVGAGRHGAAAERLQGAPCRRPADYCPGVFGGTVPVPQEVSEVVTSSPCLTDGKFLRPGPSAC